MLAFIALLKAPHPPRLAIAPIPHSSKESIRSLYAAAIGADAGAL